MLFLMVVICTTYYDPVGHLGRTETSAAKLNATPPTKIATFIYPLTFV